MKTNLQKAKAAWPDELPEWVSVLANACDQDGQKKVAEQIQYSPAVVSTVINRSYKGSLAAIQKAVEGALMNATVVCPAVGEIGMQQCQAYQRRPFRATNSMRVRIYRACRDGCPHSRFTEGGGQ